MAVSGVNSAGAAAQTYSSGARIAENFQTFLQLLTTQLQNQNPLDPLDTNQFTQQLVQFAGVEQQIATNQTLSALLQVMDTSHLANAANFVGKSVIAEGATTVLDDVSAVWYINAAKEAPGSKVIVKDANGNEVFSQNIGLKKGSQIFTWDGRGNDGQIKPDGFYTLTVVGKDAQGGTVSASLDIRGEVTGVEMEDGQPVLKIGDVVRVKLGDVKQIVKPAVETPPPAGGDDETPAA
jgi:flagellar basal-body rod modification protein FlgD